MPQMTFPIDEGVKDEILSLALKISPSPDLDAVST